MDSVFNSNNNSIYGNYGNGMTYGANTKELTWTNPISPEEERSLQGTTGISLDIPKENMIRAKCTHRDPATRNFTLKRNEDGSVTCLKCGARFNVVDNVPMKDINRVVGGVIDILQTAKMAYVDMTPEVIQTYFVILPFLEIAPKMFETAMHTLDKVTNGAGITNNHAPGDQFNSLYSAMGGMGMMNPMMMAAMMAQMNGMNGNMGAGMMTPPTGEVPAAMNPMQTGSSYNMGGMMPGVNDATAAKAAAPAEGQPIQVGKKFKLD